MRHPKRPSFSISLLRWLMVISFIIGLIALAPPNQNVTATQEGTAQDQQEVIFRGLSTAVQFDISPALSSISPIEVKAGSVSEIPERPSGLEGAFGPQDIDPLVQTRAGILTIPTPLVSFDGPSNLAGVSPPDPVGDVGPNHYVAMSNLYFQIFNKTGVSLYGPAANNTLWSGFGGDCETDNAGDPIVIYDQLDDRWILSQFTSSGPTYYNCVAISTSPDPTSTYYRYAFSTGSNFPDYPKYGMWSDALYISTREFAGSSFAGIGAYAVNRSQLVAGNPGPQVISFLVPPGGTPYNVGDGLLPTDLDGATLPPAGSPNFFVGSMDDGGPYGAPQDALTLWKFHVDFVTPGLSSFALASTIPVAAFDSIFPCSPGARECIPQPGTSNKVDILSYRQRPMWRLAYRNFGSHESLVTNQAVEAGPNVAGIRWYEIRDPNGTPTIYQQGTYAPGVSDGIHRWMGSIAMDSSGNMALGYSASDATNTYPSSWYTGRLSTDPLGTMNQGEGSIINGTGSQTGSQRWGDYTSMNVDPVDECTFWYVNEYIPTSSSNGWRLRIGAFKFAQCGPSDFTLDATPSAQGICTPNDAVYTVDVGSVQGFSDPVTLSASGNPAGTTLSFNVNPVNPPGSSVLTIGNTGAASPGSYSIDIMGTAPSSTHTINVGLDLYSSAPLAPTLLTPANGAVNVPVLPTFTWLDAGASSYLIEIASDAGFTTIVDSAIVAGTSYTPVVNLDGSTTYYWRVTGENACGTGNTSTVFSFTTIYQLCSVPNLAIPDNTPAGVTDTLVVGNNGTLIDLDVSVLASHTWVGDLSFTLTHQDTGTSATIIDRPGVPNSTFGCSGNDYDVNVNDEGVDTPIESQCGSNPPAISGNAEGGDPPGAVLSVFDGEDLSGTWLLNVTDHAGGDTGTLNQWCLAPSLSGEPDIHMVPVNMDEVQSTDMQTTHPITISNIGTADLIWTIGEAQLVKKPANDPNAPSRIPGDPAFAQENVGDVDEIIPDSAPNSPLPVSSFERPQDILYDNGPLVTHPGSGAGGADASAVQTALSMNTYGFGHQFSLGYRVADDFNVPPGGWIINNITFFAYQTGSTTASTMTGVTLRILDGPPGQPGTNVVWGDTSTNVMIDTTWANLYRVLDTNLVDTNRPVMADTVAVNTFLPAGQYWLDWNTNGSLASGPWAPPVSLLSQTTTGDAWQSLDGGVIYTALVDTGTGTAQGLPFIIEGTSTMCGSPSDIPWLSVAPAGGSNAPGSNSVVSMTLDSTGMATGVYTGTVCVNSNDPDLPLVEVPVTMTVWTPAISLVKTVGTDPMACASTDTITVLEGSDVSYCYEVTNTGDITLPFHDLSDSILGDILSGFNYALSPGASVFITQTVNITQTTTNTATWTAYDAGHPLITSAADSATVNVIPRNPSIAIAKTVGTVPGVCATTDTITVATGTMVYYCVEVTNTGNITLTLHDLDDDQLGTIFSGLAYDLAPGASVNTVAAGLTISTTATNDTVNTATWTAYNPGPSDATTATASATVNVIPTLFLPIILR